MKNIFKEFKKFWLLWLILIFLVVLFGYLALGEFQRWYALRREIKEKEQEIEQLAQQTQEFSEELKGTGDPYLLEKEARQTLNLKREGEEVFVVLGLESVQEPEDFSEIYDMPLESENKLWFNVKSWWRYFFKNN